MTSRVFATCCLLATPLAFEILARAAFAVWLHDPAVLVVKPADFGPYSAMQPDLHHDGYRKYRPNSHKRLYVGHAWFGMRPYHVAINALGFRGSQPIRPKPSGVFRVVCLGESSTLGAFNPDEDTYPVLLEKALNNAAPLEWRFEVLNFGVARQTSAALGPLLRREVLPLQPDLVTYYGGHNDARDVVLGPPRDSAGAGGRWLLPPLARFLLARFIDRGPGLPAIERAHEESSRRLRANVLTAAGALRKAGIPFVVATQKYNGNGRAPSAYADEFARVSAYAARAGAFATQTDAMIYVHYRLMLMLRDFAPDRFELVDGIAALDRTPDAFTTHVHLQRAGNAALASAFSARILPFAAGRARPAPQAARTSRPDGMSPTPIR